MKLYNDIYLSLVVYLEIVVLSISSNARMISMDTAARGMRRPPPIKSKPRNNVTSAIPETFFHTPVNCNRHNFTFTINEPKLCIKQEEVFLLILIRSIYSQMDRRLAIRQTWGNQRNFRNHRVVLAFLFGAAENRQNQRGLEEESRRYGDIIQENFKDSYANLTLKDVMALKWAWLYCPHAQFVLIGSDEVVIDVFKLSPFLEYSILSTDMTSFNQRFTLCHLYPCCTKVYHEHPKYSVDVKKYSGNAFPNYCSGTAYIVPSDVVRKLYSMSWDTPSFMPDDAWIGVLAEKLGLTFHDTFRSFTGIRNYPTVMKGFLADNYFDSELMIGVLDYDFPGKEAVMMKRIWQLILKHHEGRKISHKFWRDMYSRSYPGHPVDQQNEMQFAVGFGLFLDVVILAILIVICYWLKKKKFKYLCRRWFKQ